MRIEKQIYISGINFTRTSNVPIKIKFDNHQIHSEATELRLSREHCLQLGLVDIPELVEREVTVCLESQVNTRQGRHDDPEMFVEGQVKVGNFRIGSLQKVESVFIPNKADPDHPTRVRSHCTLELRTGSGGGTLYVIRSPHGSFHVNLTEEEYEECKKLPAGAFFQVSFRVGEKFTNM